MPYPPGHAPYLVGTSCAFRTPFSYTLRILVGKNSLYNLPGVLTPVSRNYPLFVFRAVPAADLSNMSSQDSEGESYVADYLADPKVYGDVEHCGWKTEEEEDYEPKGKEETSSEEDEVPLPQPGDMHVEFKKSSLLYRVKKPKIEFIPFCPLQENKQELCKKILRLEQDMHVLSQRLDYLARS